MKRIPGGGFQFLLGLHVRKLLRICGSIAGTAPRDSECRHPEEKDCRSSTVAGLPVAPCMRSVLFLGIFTGSDVLLM